MSLRVRFVNGNSRVFEDNYQLAKFIIFGKESLGVGILEAPKLVMTSDVRRLLKMKRQINFNIALAEKPWDSE